MTKKTKRNWDLADVAAVMRAETKVSVLDKLTFVIIETNDEHLKTTLKDIYYDISSKL